MKFKAPRLVTRLQRSHPQAARPPAQDADVIFLSPPTSTSCPLHWRMEEQQPVSVFNWVWTMITTRLMIDFSVTYFGRLLFLFICDDTNNWFSYLLLLVIFDDTNDWFSCYFWHIKNLQVSSYYKQLNVECFYPDVVISFYVQNPKQHYHVPLLLNPYGYSTYRGSWRWRRRRKNKKNNNNNYN